MILHISGGLRGRIGRQSTGAQTGRTNASCPTSALLALGTDRMSIDTLHASGFAGAGRSSVSFSIVSGGGGSGSGKEAVAKSGVASTPGKAPRVDSRQDENRAAASKRELPPMPAETTPSPAVRVTKARVTTQNRHAHRVRSTDRVR